MTPEKPFVVTVETRYRVEVTTEAASEAEAARNATTHPQDRCELVSAPECISVRVLSVREVGRG